MSDSCFISIASLKWALGQLGSLPKDQSALFFILALSKEPSVKATSGAEHGFISELGRYLFAPIKGGGSAVFNPMDGSWRAENYIQSTIYGRLLNGSHWWTSPENGFLKRLPGKTWPATFEFTDEGFNRLFRRDSAPCLKYEHRLPLRAVAIYYFRNENLALKGVHDLDSLVELYKLEVLVSNANLSRLFVADGPVFWGDLFSEEKPTEEQVLSCYPASPFAGEPKTNVLVYNDDLLELKTRLNGGDSFADAIRRLLERTR